MGDVEIIGLTKRFGTVLAVDNFTLKINDGDFIVLLGPSGSGKTTILRCIAGLETADEGDIYIDGVKVNDLEPKDRDIAMVFQNYALYPHMTVYQNLAFPLECRRVPKDKIRERVEKVANLLKIGELLHRKPKQLSGGQQQRVALGRAIIREPKVFLMDEPLSNLDAKLRIYMRAELKRLQKELDITTIYVTHDQIEAMTMADKIAVINNGRLQQYNEPNQIYSNPVNTFVAGFIGSPPTNFFEGTLKEDGYIDIEGFRYPLPNDIVDDIRSRLRGDKVILGIRPNSIKVYRDKAPGRIRASIYTVEPMGDSQILDLKIESYIFKAVVEPDFKVDGEVWLEFPLEKIYLFDGRDGERIL
jgi:multiple sugar transport system ATP-binding protein